MFTRVLSCEVTTVFTWGGEIFLFSPFQNRAGIIQTVENHFDSALCENEPDARSANQNAGLECKINSANQGVVEGIFLNPPSVDLLTCLLLLLVWPLIFLIQLNLFCVY